MYFLELSICGLSHYSSMEESLGTAKDHAKNL